MLPAPLSPLPAAIWVVMACLWGAVMLASFRQPRLLLAGGLIGTQLLGFYWWDNLPPGSLEKVFAPQGTVIVVTP